MTASSTVILLRHGQSEWNDSDRFAGWIDVGLTRAGEMEARRAGEALKAAGLLPDVVHTSVLRRAILTAHILLDAADRLWVPEWRTWRLNERHYGALQGRRRDEILAEYGPEQYGRWRRHVDVRPPPLSDELMRAQSRDPRYARLGACAPSAESLADVMARLRPYWVGRIAPDITAGKTVMVVAHGNTLRSILERDDRRGPDAVSGLEIPTGVPLVYRVGVDGVSLEACAGLLSS